MRLTTAYALKNVCSMGWYGVESLNHGAVCSILKSLYSDILNDDERNFACITIYTVGWQVRG